MDTIKHYLRKLLMIFFGILVFLGIAVCWSLFDYNHEMNILAKILMVVFGILLLLLGGGGLFLMYAMTKRCKQCKRWFAIAKRDTVKTQSKKIYVAVENKTRSAYSGEVTAYTEQHIPGKRNTYKTTYTCKYCGAEEYKYKSVDTPNT